MQEAAKRRMPPKRKTKRAAATETEAEESYDIDSIAMDDAPASATFHPTAAPTKAVDLSVPPDSTAAATGTSSSNLADDTLQALINGASIISTVDAVLHLFRQGHDTTGMCTLLNVLAKASGVVDVELDANALADGIDIGPLLEELYIRVPEDAAAYLLVNRDNTYRRLRRAFPEFFQQLMHLSFSADLLLGDVLLPTLTQWIIPMSESKSRSFRHTATVAILGMVYGLFKLEAGLKSQISLTRVKKNMTELGKQLADIAQWRDHIFSQGLHQRVRDVAPEIRTAVIQSLKDWVLEFPEECMVSKYLRYFSMAFHDRKAELRAEGLDMVLQALARVPDAFSRMRLFLQHFMGRFVEMSNDVDVRCAELAIRVVAMIVRCDTEGNEGRELHTNEMIDRVLLSLFDERPTVRSAAGVLLKVFIHCRTVGEADEEEQVRVATELLCSFASTLRIQYMEAMPEKYLIDALWSNERPPLLLTEFKPMLEMATGAARTAPTPTETVVGLSLLTALLLKLRGRLILGPLPKDDRRQPPRRLTPAVQEQVVELLHRVTESVGGVLCDILEKHRGDQQVLRAVGHTVGALDLGVFTNQSQTACISALLVELRKATTTVLCEVRTRDALVAAWHSLAFTEHPSKNVAQAHLQEILKQVLKQLTQLDKAAASLRGASVKDALPVWGRVHLISSLVSVVDQWPIIKGSLFRQLSKVSTSRDVELLGLMIDSAVNSILWHISVQQSDPTINPETISEHMTELVGLCFQVLDTQVLEDSSSASSESQGRETVNMAVLSKVLLHLFDVCALRYHDLLQNEQETLVRKLEGILEYLASQFRLAQEAVRTAVAVHGDDTVLSPITKPRQQCSCVEATMLRLVVGISRLFLFQRIDVSFAASVLVLWTRVHSKVVSDTFKALFHALRDRLGDSYPLERDIMAAAYNRCAEDGVTALSVEALYQTGSKLASLHFLGTDRYYDAVSSMIRFGMQFATSTDPLMLQGIVPYCSKLRVVDALALLRHDMASVELFTNTTNVYAKTFVGAMRRAAKLQYSDSQSMSMKRPRELTIPAEDRDEALLAAIAESTPRHSTNTGAASRSGRPNASNKVSVASRAVTEDGWHVVPSQEDVSASVTPVSSDAAKKLMNRSGRSIVDVPTTQETVTSELMDDNEVFIATQEYE